MANMAENSEVNEDSLSEPMTTNEIKFELNQRQVVKEETKAESNEEEVAQENGDESSHVKCDHCDYICSYDPNVLQSFRVAQQRLSGHKNDEHGHLKFKCTECPKSFWTEKLLHEHLHNHKFKPNEEGDFQCEYCDYKCKKIARIKQHVNQVHLGVRPHLCDFCSAAFPTKSSLNKHRMSHTGERNFPCMFCEKKFHSKHNLVTHVRTHTGEKPFTCDTCGESFSDQSHFAKHKRSHQTDADGNKVKDFLCEICNKAFARNAELKYHMMAHEAGRDGKKAKYTPEFKLAAIERTKIIGMSQTAEEMKINMSTLKSWIQLTVHPHKCDICDKAYPIKGQLKKHMLTHPQYRHNMYTTPQDGMQDEVKHSNFNPEDVQKKTIEGKKTFSMFLAQNSMLPSEEVVKAREEEKQRKEQEKQNLALVAKELFEKKLQEQKIQEEKERSKLKTFPPRPVQEQFNNQNPGNQFPFNNDWHWNAGSIPWSYEVTPMSNQNIKQEVEEMVEGEDPNEENEDFENFDVKEEPDDDNFEPNLFEPDTCLQTEENVEQVDQNMELEDDQEEDKDDDNDDKDDNSNVQKADLGIKHEIKMIVKEEPNETDNHIVLEPHYDENYKKEMKMMQIKEEFLGRVANGIFGNGKESIGYPI